MYRGLTNADRRCYSRTVAEDIGKTIGTDCAAALDVIVEMWADNVTNGRYKVGNLHYVPMSRTIGEKIQSNWTENRTRNRLEILVEKGYLDRIPAPISVGAEKNIKKIYWYTPTQKTLSTIYTVKSPRNLYQYAEAKVAKCGSEKVAKKSKNAPTTPATPAAIDMDKVRSIVIEYYGEYATNFDLDDEESVRDLAECVADDGKRSMLVGYADTLKEAS